MLEFLIFVKFWWKIKSLSVAGDFLYEDVTPMDIFVGVSFLVFSLFGCLTSQCVG